MSFFKRLFGRKDRSPADAEPVAEEVVAEEVVAEPPVRWPASPDHFAIIEAPAPPPVEEEPLAEPQPTVESPALTAGDLTFSTGPEPEPEPEPEEEGFLEPEPEPEPHPEPAVVEPPVAVAVEEPDAPITVARMDEAAALEVLERALDELGSAHHRPFSRG
jgi:hypothetical protein